eukprot:12067645-Ditylum_brightwellii.AAC.1
MDQYMEHIHASKAKRVALLDKKQKITAAAKKTVKNIETSSETAATTTTVMATTPVKLTRSY